MYKLGIDVGGTNTDAVIIDERLQVVAEVKHPTTEDVYDGILCALREVIDRAGIDRKSISQAMLGLPSVPTPLWREKIWRRLAWCASALLRPPASLPW